ncbi:MAG: hypothetical protein ACI3XC_07870 [Phascolarctobacterium sp.]
MSYAYDRVYLDKARIALGRMLDFAVYNLKYEISEFFDLFVKSSVAKYFCKREIEKITSKSGEELAYEVLDSNGINMLRIKPNYVSSSSEEYWTGWAVAFYQWQKGMSFAELVRHVPIDKITKLYATYHEMDIRQFCEKMDSMYQLNAG